jgi:hypothetical protein
MARSCKSASEGRISWCKSAPATDDGLSITLLLGQFDDTGLDLQVNLSVGDGHARTRCTVASPDYLPSIATSSRALTGVRFTLTTIEASPEVIVATLFLAATDVKVGRNRLWHLDADHGAGVPEDLRKLLSYGRSGEIAT